MTATWTIVLVSGLSRQQDPSTMEQSSMRLAVQTMLWNRPWLHGSTSETPERNVILHMYDDRGLDVIASQPEVLVPLYPKFNQWILDDDREQIDRVFSALAGRRVSISLQLNRLTTLGF